MTKYADTDTLIHGVAPDDQPTASFTEWLSNDRRFRVYGVGTKDLGYIYPAGDPANTLTGVYGEVRTGYTPTTTVFRATDRDGAELGTAATERDAVALIVAAAHSA